MKPHSVNDHKLWAAAAVIITDSVVYEALTADAGLENACFLMCSSSNSSRLEASSSQLAANHIHGFVSLTVHLIVYFLF